VHNVTQKQSITRSQSPNPYEPPFKCPHHRQGLIWSPTDATFSPTAHSSEYAEPVPSPPLNEISNIDAARTIAWRPDLFRIVTPIIVD